MPSISVFEHCHRTWTSEPSIARNISCDLQPEMEFYQIATSDGLRSPLGPQRTPKFAANEQASSTSVSNAECQWLDWEQNNVISYSHPSSTVACTVAPCRFSRRVGSGPAYSTSARVFERPSSSSCKSKVWLAK